MSTATVLALVGLLLSTASSFAATVTFKYTGEEQTFTVPAGVTSVHVTATGAAGSEGSEGSAAGHAAITEAELPVTVGQILYVEVGGLPTTSPGCYPQIACIGGFNGGGSSHYGGGGGGASDVRLTSMTQAGTLQSRLIVAAGGGGGGFFCSGGAGGNAGEAGSQGGDCGVAGGTGGGAGNLLEGGAGGNPSGEAGSLGLGGSNEFAGGGGGGLYGGGSGGKVTIGPNPEPETGGSGGGGGGSSLVPSGGTMHLATALEAGTVIVSYLAPSKITFPPLSDRAYGEAPFTVTASASSALPVTFSASGECKTSAAGLVNLTGVGVCTITAHQEGDSQNAAATPVSQSFNVKPRKTVTRLSQTKLHALRSRTTTITALVHAASAEQSAGALAGTATLYIGGHRQQSVRVSSGIARFTYTPRSTGRLNVRIVYHGSPTDESSSTTATLTVREHQVHPIVTG
jgi:hypothetical protein